MEWFIPYQDASDHPTFPKRDFPASDFFLGTDFGAEEEFCAKLGLNSSSASYPKIPGLLGWEGDTRTHPRGVGMTPERDNPNSRQQIHGRKFPLHAEVELLEVWNLGWVGSWTRTPNEEPGPRGLSREWLQEPTRPLQSNHSHKHVPASLEAARNTH